MLLILCKERPALGLGRGDSVLIMFLMIITLQVVVIVKQKSYICISNALDLHKNKEMKLMETTRKSGQAILSNQGEMTSFRYGGYNIRFRTSAILKKYVEVKEWDNGYIVVMADYDGMGLTEEYIDLIPILENLYINPESFLKNIQSVKIGNYEQ